MLQNLYDNQMVKSDGPGRWLYDEIRLLTSICPLCKHQVVGNLDHYLPKSEFPLLSVAPSNLVPVCRDCNYAKLNTIGTSAGDVALNPYFDDLGPDQWLWVELVEESPCAALFSVIPPSAWSHSLGQRVSQQFNLLGLGKMYSAQAVREMTNIRGAMERAFDRAGAVGVRQQLDDQSFSRRLTDANSWSAALYTALYQSDWYCNGGYKL